MVTLKDIQRPDGSVRYIGLKLDKRPGTLCEERALHRLLRDHPDHIRGEWYENTPEIRAAIGF